MAGRAYALHARQGPLTPTVLQVLLAYRAHWGHTQQVGLRHVFRVPSECQTMTTIRQQSARARHQAHIFPRARMEICRRLVFSVRQGIPTLTITRRLVASSARPPAITFRLVCLDCAQTHHTPARLGSSTTTAIRPPSAYSVRQRDTMFLKDRAGHA